MMEFLSPLWNYVLPFIVILTILVFVHEMGHYLVARRCGVKIEVFSIGFGPELFGWNDRSGTRWKFSTIPLGGYVKMFGDADAASSPNMDTYRLSAEERRVSFYHKSLGQRAATVFAGPFVNYLFAIVVLTALFSTFGQPYSPPVIGTVFAHGAAAKAGLEPGDRILSVNGRPIDRFEEVLQMIALRPGEKVDMTINRSGRRRVVSLAVGKRDVRDSHGNVQVIGDLGAWRMVRPVVGRVLKHSAASRGGLKPGDRFVDIDGHKIVSFQEVHRLIMDRPGKTFPIVVERHGKRVRLIVTPTVTKTKAADGTVKRTGLLGVGAAPAPRLRFDPMTAAWQALRETYAITLATGKAIGQMVSGTRTFSDLGGPLRIAEMSGHMAQSGFYAFFWFLGVLSLHLCLINLLPVPMLDGGHLLFYGFEAIRGRPLGPKAQEYGFRIGLALVLTLMVVVTWNDLVHLRVVAFIRSLIT
jgi:regulator of sigma E protease